MMGVSECVRASTAPYHMPPIVLVLNSGIISVLIRVFPFRLHIK